MNRLERGGELLQNIAADLRRYKTVDEVLEILPKVTRGYVEYWQREIEYPRVKGRGPLHYHLKR